MIQRGEEIKEGMRERERENYRAKPDRARLHMFTFGQVT